MAAPEMTCPSCRFGVVSMSGVNDVDIEGPVRASIQVEISMSLFLPLDGIDL